MYRFKGTNKRWLNASKGQLRSIQVISLSLRHKLSCSSWLSVSLYVSSAMTHTEMISAASREVNYKPIVGFQ